MGSKVGVRARNCKGIVRVMDTFLQFLGLGMAFEID